MNDLLPALLITLSRPVATGHIRWKFPPHFFVQPKFCCAQKNLFQIYNINKNLAPLKIHFDL